MRNLPRANCLTAAIILLTINIFQAGTGQDIILPDESYGNKPSIDLSNVTVDLLKSKSKTNLTSAISIATNVTGADDIPYGATVSAVNDSLVYSVFLFGADTPVRTVIIDPANGAVLSITNMTNNELNRSAVSLFTPTIPLPPLVFTPTIPLPPLRD